MTFIALISYSLFSLPAFFRYQAVLYLLIASTTKSKERTAFKQVSRTTINEISTFLILTSSKMQVMPLGVISARFFRSKSWMTTIIAENSLHQTKTSFFSSLLLLALRGREQMWISVYASIVTGFRSQDKMRRAQKWVKTTSLLFFKSVKSKRMQIAVISPASINKNEILLPIDIPIEKYFSLPNKSQRRVSSLKLRTPVIVAKLKNDCSFKSDAAKLTNDGSFKPDAAIAYVAIRTELMTPMQQIQKWKSQMPWKQSEIGASSMVISSSSSIDFRKSFYQEIYLRVNGDSDFRYCFLKVLGWEPLPLSTSFSIILRCERSSSTIVTTSYFQEDGDSDSHFIRRTICFVKNYCTPSEITIQNVRSDQSYSKVVTFDRPSSPKKLLRRAVAGSASFNGTKSRLFQETILWEARVRVSRSGMRNTLFINNKYN